jgi:hypothetical protein
MTTKGRSSTTVSLKQCSDVKSNKNKQTTQQRDGVHGKRVSKLPSQTVDPSESEEVVAVSSSSSSSADYTKKRKASVLSPPQQVHLFKEQNPTNYRMSEGKQEDFDWGQYESAETKKIIRSRQSSTIAPVSSANMPPQIFNIFQIPVKLDTNFLSLHDLQEELRARGLPVLGNKQKLKQRLEMAITTTTETAKPK